MYLGGKLSGNVNAGVTELHSNLGVSTGLGYFDRLV